ncbi:HigA family addiction module antitoxin [Asticcacaulis sp. ZE23SCel15]|uniref:HigA family addiction module antitoxin n=1 Tax=Asticcacaulis sp. ZE23SCel15 TaxID=3059027 RepID=UPI00265DCCE2|nr:HigA family addiction module antitoxin [Asticcacaulis sp. ZE23SCel15]WKL55987.1 HigA family addiction module antitoxin [Asticcacaulis sp. ZE23SCel15]
MSHIEIEHPGVMLREDFLEAMGIKPGALAAAIGVDRAAIKKIIEGKRAITAEMALRLSIFFGTTAEFWMNLQSDYDLRMARRERLEEFSLRILPKGLA